MTDEYDRSTPSSRDTGGPEAQAVGVAPSGHRLPPSTRLGAVRLQVADLGRSVDWYGRVLGMKVLDRGGGTARLGSLESDHALVELHEHPGATPVPRTGRLGLYHFALLLPDRPALGAFVRHLADLGVPAGSADHLVSEAIYLQDPDNLGIEVYADRPRDTWRVQEREIAMDTRPLDAIGLARAARDTNWTGLPAGTVMGHVHLHVGDLGAADAFYHQALGFDRVVWSYPGALFLSAGGYHHHLGLNTWSAGGPAGEGDARLLEWEIEVPSLAAVEATTTSLSDAGYDVSEGEAADARVRDPWGTALRISAGELRRP